VRATEGAAAFEHGGQPRALQDDGSGRNVPPANSEARETRFLRQPSRPATASTMPGNPAPAANGLLWAVDKSARRWRHFVVAGKFLKAVFSFAERKGKAVLICGNLDLDWVAGIGKAGRAEARPPDDALRLHHQERLAS